MAEPDIYAKFAELYIAHEKLKAKYQDLARDIIYSAEGRNQNNSHRGSNAEYLLEQKDV